jgi:hypothetical protein
MMCTAFVMVANKLDPLAAESMVCELSVSCGIGCMRAFVLART